MVRHNDGLSDISTRHGTRQICRIRVGDPSRRYWEITLWGSIGVEYAHTLTVGDVITVTSLRVSVWRNNNTTQGSSTPSTMIIRRYQHQSPAASLAALTSSSANSKNKAGGSPTISLRDAIRRYRDEASLLLPNDIPPLAATAAADSMMMIHVPLFAPSPAIFLSTLSSIALQCIPLRTAILLEWACTAEGGLLDPYLLPSSMASSSSSNRSPATNSTAITFSALDSLVEGRISHVYGRLLECDQPLAVHQRPPQTSAQLQAAVAGMNTTRTK
jgi:hypothetical protein